MITLIAAASMNNVIGYQGEIPWKLSNDFKRFKELTSGHAIIMGRKTFDSLPGILPNRKHIVVTRDSKKVDQENVVYVNSLEDAFRVTNAFRIDINVFVIGGGEIYEQSMQYADKIELTRVQIECIGDAFFPGIDLEDFKLINIDCQLADDKNSADYIFQTFVAKKIIMKVGITFSCFDLLHAGHVKMLEEAKTKCDWLIVGLQTDPTIDRPEKSKPVQTIVERYIQLKGCKFVDDIVPYSTEQDLLDILQTFDIQVRIIGADYKDKDFTGKDYCINSNIDIFYNYRDHRFSSTNLKRTIIKQSATIN